MSNMAKAFRNLFVIALLCASTFYGGYYFGQRGFVINIKKNPPQINIFNREPTMSDLDFSLFWTVWDSINKNHIDRPLDSKKLFYGAISGMVSAIGDDYTSFFTPTQNEAVRGSLKGEYEGIGAELGFKDKQLIIISPLEGSPAEAAGVRPGDKILGIEGKGTVGITLSEAVSQIRGKAGTVSTLTLQRGNDAPVELKITRSKILAKATSWKDLGDGVGYIRVSRFGDTLTEEWPTMVHDMKRQMPNLKSVVLDFRGNPGGYLNSAVFIASEFVNEGKVILYQEVADGTQSPFKANRKGTLIEYPVVVLVNGGSASASEIVAGALRDIDDSKIVGEKSFGKGTVQSSEEYDDGSAVHVTIAKWITPNKTWVHKVGITPDFMVENKEEDSVEGKDLQLDKAKEVALTEAANAK